MLKGREGVHGFCYVPTAQSWNQERVRIYTGSTRVFSKNSRRFMGCCRPDAATVYGELFTLLWLAFASSFRRFGRPVDDGLCFVFQDIGTGKLNHIIDRPERVPRCFSKHDEVSLHQALWLQKTN